MENQQNNPEQKEEQKPLMGFDIIPSEGKTHSEDYAETLKNGIVVCDGVGTGVNPRLAAMTVCETFKNLEPLLESINSEGDTAYEATMDKILSDACATLAAIKMTNEIATTADVAYLDSKRRLHIAHRGDGVVMIVKNNISETLILTPPEEGKESLNEPIKGHVSPLGTYKNWGFQTYAEMESAIKSLWEYSTESREKMLRVILKQSDFPELIKGNGRTFDIHGILQNLLYHEMEDDGTPPRLSENTRFVHHDCKPGDIVIAMSDGVLDNMIFAMQMQEALQLGMKENLASNVVLNYSFAQSGEDRNRIIKRTEKILKMNGVPKDFDIKFRSWALRFMDIHHWFNALCPLVVTFVNQFRGQKTGMADPKKLAFEFTHTYANQIKKDDATTAVCIVR